MHHCSVIAMATSPSPRHVNRVLLPRGQLGRGLKLVGGRGYGVFVHSHRHTSRGLQTGDQITKVTSPIQPSPTAPANHQCLHETMSTISGRWSINGLNVS